MHLINTSLHIMTMIPHMTFLPYSGALMTVHCTALTDSQIHCSTYVLQCIQHNILTGHTSSGYTPEE